MLDSNPVYDTPGMLKFSERAQKVGKRVKLGLYHDETSYICHWSLPLSHFLEAWGDGRSYEGTITLQQPLISPLYESRSSLELLSEILNPGGVNVRDFLSTRWKDFDTVLQDGYVKETHQKHVNVKLSPGTLSDSENKSTGELEAQIKPDPTIWDGR